MPVRLTPKRLFPVLCALTIAFLGQSSPAEAASTIIVDAAIPIGGGNQVRVVVGRTSPQDWVPYPAGNTIQVHVDTSAAGFASTPTYLTSLSGDGYMYITTGATSIYRQNRDGFDVYLGETKNVPMNVQLAIQNGWHLNWVAVTAPEPAPTAQPTTDELLEEVVDLRSRLQNQQREIRRLGRSLEQLEALIGLGDGPPRPNAPR